MYIPIYPKCRGYYKNNLWETFSNKIKRKVKLFSDLEYDHWILIEMNSDIVDFCEQPKKITLIDNGNKYESIFDMWVLTKNGEECFIEIKYQNELDPNNVKSARSIKQTNIQRDWCKQNGFNYAIKTEHHIRSNKNYLANCRTILPFIKNRNHSLDLERHKLLRLINNNRLTLFDIYNQLPNIPISIIYETICWLIYTGIVRSNIDEAEFGPNTEVWINV